MLTAYAERLHQLQEKIFFNYYRYSNAGISYLFQSDNVSFPRNAEIVPYEEAQLETFCPADFKKFLLLDSAKSKNIDQWVTEESFKSSFLPRIQKTHESTGYSCSKQRFS